jgi:hypothetical protein
MDQSKKEFLTVVQGVKLSNTQNSTTAEEIEWMKVIPYASAIGSIKYAMLCSLSCVWQKRYQSDPGVDHWIAVKLSLR